MKLFKKTIYTAILSAIICSASFMYAGFARAQDSGNLSVVFTQDPLFQEANFLPGSSVYGSAQVTNTSGEERPIAIEAINITNDEVGGGQYFGDALDLIISENSTELYSNTLTEFFNAGEINLSNLANNASTTYNFTIIFNETTENNYQSKNLGFDILIGFQGEGSGGGGGGGTTGGGGSSGGRVYGLSIFSEASTNITDTTATIEWTTSYMSTSRIIYCEESQNCVFDFYDTDDDPSLYGYEFTTLEYDTPAIPNGVTHHSVTITGLVPSTNYNYRVISHASPPTISREHSFTTLASSEHAKDIGQDIEEVEVLGEETTPILNIEKNFESEFANPGDTIKYEIEITNNGNFDALDVIINESLPEGIVFENNSQREQIFTLGNIKPNESRKMSYSVIIDKNIMPGVYLSSTKLSALNHDIVESKASFEIRASESSQGGEAPVAEIEEASQGQANQEDLTIAPEQGEISEEGNQEDVSEKDEETEDDKPQEEIKESNIKEWLFWILLLIIAIELYILINKKKEKKEENDEGEINE